MQELFNRIGPVAKLDLKYDRAGRSEGVAFVTMESREDALDAIKQFDGANANGKCLFSSLFVGGISKTNISGQPIKLSIIGGGAGGRSRNPFDSAVMPGRPLAERISAPGGRSRSMSPGRRYDVDEAAERGIDRYVPGSRGNRSRSPMPRRRGNGGGGGGRRPGARRDGGRDGGRDQEGGRGGRSGRDGRTRKTQEELDAEMADYFGGGNSGEAAPQPNGGAAAAAVPAANDDIDMIE